MADQKAEQVDHTPWLREAATQMHVEESPTLRAVAAWLDDIAERHKPDPEPVDLMLHYDEPCPTGECEEYGHTVTACWGCYPTWDGMDGRAVYPCIETKAALKVAEAYLPPERSTS